MAPRDRKSKGAAYKNREKRLRDITLSPGETPGSELETKALLSLLERLKPRAVIVLHAALARINDADESFLGRQLAESTGLPLDPVKYATPGSVGSWAQEHGMNLVTYEFEPASPYALKEGHTPVQIDVLTGVIDPEE